MEGRARKRREERGREHKGGGKGEGEAEAEADGIGRDKGIGERDNILEETSTPIVLSAPSFFIMIVRIPSPHARSKIV